MSKKNVDKCSNSEDMEQSQGIKLPQRLAGYSKKQSDFIIALLDSGVVIEACRVAKVSEGCAYKWLNDGLDKEIREIRAALIEKDLNKLQLACGLAVDTLISVLQDKRASMSVKVNASKAILDNTMKIREQEQFINRVEALEEALKNVVNDEGSNVN